MLVNILNSFEKYYGKTKKYKLWEIKYKWKNKDDWLL